MRVYIGLDVHARQTVYCAEEERKIEDRGQSFTLNIRKFYRAKTPLRRGASAWASRETQDLAPTRAR